MRSRHQIPLLSKRDVESNDPVTVKLWCSNVRTVASSPQASNIKHQAHNTIQSNPSVPNNQSPEPTANRHRSLSTKYCLEVSVSQCVAKASTYCTSPVPSSHCGPYAMRSIERQKAETVQNPASTHKHPNDKTQHSSKSDSSQRANTSKPNSVTSTTLNIQQLGPYDRIAPTALL